MDCRSRDVPGPSLVFWNHRRVCIVSFEQEDPLDQQCGHSEQALFLNVANVALFAPSTSEYNRDQWDRMVSVTCDCIVKSRYAAYGALYKAFDREWRLDSRVRFLGSQLTKSQDEHNSTIG